MSAPRLISPLLDNFVMGEPIYNQGGIRILPAMKQDKEEKYIVKIISIPANQSQVDALLITGAYKDADAVNSYFAELADGTIREAGVLSKLSNSGGFDGYENMQVVPMDDGNGYDVYLLAPYRPTWDRVSQQKSITQLDGYNLALDLCAALSVARRNGYLYANLKPESVSVTTSGSYHISDLGLIDLTYLQYSSLPTGYFSKYTAPEIADAYSSLNSTLDVYALGMMLYEIFNDGLPFDGVRASATEYAAPAYAEEEFGQIILKAIHPEPAERWQSPTEMGQAIVSLMQRKGVSDTPIVPVVEESEVDEQTDVPVLEETEVTDEIISETATEVTEDENTEEEIVEDNPAEDETSSPAIDNDGSEMINAKEETVSNSVDPETDQEITDEEQPPIPVETDAITEGDAAESTGNILEKADELLEDLGVISEETSEDETYEQLAIEEPAEEEQITDVQDDGTKCQAADESEEESKPKKSGKRKALIICSAILIALLIIGGLFFYRHIYLQEIDSLFVTGEADTVTVTVSTDIDSSKLTVVCTDANGNTYEADLVDYKATVSGLPAETNYTVSLNIDGFHKLIGKTECTYATPQKTVIKDFTVLNGTEEGTAEVSYQLDGPNDGEWTVAFSAQGEEPIVASAIDGKAIITGLTSGKPYTVTLSSSAPLYMDKNVQLSFTPGPSIKPINPHIVSCIDGKLTVAWSIPEDAGNASWVVRCYNNESYDETIVVNEGTASFNIPDDKKAYTVEVSAQGQAAKETLLVSDNAVTLSDFNIDTSLPGRITLNWTASADVPEGGYIVSYTVDGVQVKETITTNSNSLTLLGAVPNADHTFYFASSNGSSVLSAPITVKATGENPFSAFGVKAGNMRFNLCPRPSKNNWSYKDVKSSAYTTTFAVGQKAGVAARILSRYYTSDEVVATVYVFRNADGAIVHTCFTEQEWGDMWSNGYGAFDIPSLPELSGSYKLDMYIDGGLVFQTKVTIK